MYLVPNYESVQSKELLRSSIAQKTCDIPVRTNLSFVFENQT